MVWITGLEPRRRKLRIARASALQNLSARALTHSAAPHFPTKSFWTWWGPLFFKKFVQEASSDYQKNRARKCVLCFLVRITGLEPARTCIH